MVCAIQQAAGTVVVNGGVVSTPCYRSLRANGGEVVINGGEFVGQVWMQPNQKNVSLTVNGGTFSPVGGDASSIFMTNEGENCTMDSASITGGTFNGKVGVTNPDALAGCISGGRFTDCHCTFLNLCTGSRKLRNRIYNRNNIRFVDW